MPKIRVHFCHQTQVAPNKNIACTFVTRPTQGNPTARARRVFVPCRRVVSRRQCNSGHTVAGPRCNLSVCLCVCATRQQGQEATPQHAPEASTRKKLVDMGRTAFWPWPWGCLLALLPRCADTQTRRQVATGDCYRSALIPLSTRKNSSWDGHPSGP